VRKLGLREVVGVHQETIHRRDETRGSVDGTNFVPGWIAIDEAAGVDGWEECSGDAAERSGPGIGAAKEYNAAIQVAVAEKDNGSRDLFVTLLKDEEDHVDWLEAQMHMIKELGYERYLTMQMGEDEEE
jgi:hypothetical protein